MALWQRPSQLLHLVSCTRCIGPISLIERFNTAQRAVQYEALCFYLTLQEQIMNIITNAFSLNMLDTIEAQITATQIPLERAQMLVKTFEYESAVGHTDTASVFSDQLGQTIPTNRVSVQLTLTKLYDKHSLLVGQYSGPRLPEGATKLPEGAKIQWWNVFIEPVRP